MPHSPFTPYKTALVLGAGGARGAYEVGVISYLREVIEPELGHRLPIDILCGTSVGALHACLLAATADAPARQGELLREMWSALTVDQLLQFGVRDLFSVARGLLGTVAKEERPRPALVSLGGLKRLVLQKIPWSQIGRQLREGHLDALSITATHVASGRPTVFLQRKDPRASWPTLVPKTVDTTIGPRHALASAAIPLMFPPVAIEGQLYVDGALRMGVPLSPALHLGADRVIVISVSSMSGRTAGPSAHHVEQAYATAPFLLGKALNALMADHIDEDLDRLRQMNRIVEAGTRVFGERFSELLAEASQEPALRRVHELFISPSVDLSAVAAQFVRSERFARKSRGLAARFLRALADRETPSGADLVSYLLFDGEFAQALWSLGRKDAEAKHDQWLSFWTERPAVTSRPARPAGLRVALAR